MCRDDDVDVVIISDKNDNGNNHERDHPDNEEHKRQDPERQQEEHQGQAVSSPGDENGDNAVNTEENDIEIKESSCEEQKPEKCNDNGDVIKENNNNGGWRLVNRKLNSISLLWNRLTI